MLVAIEQDAAVGSSDNCFQTLLSGRDCIGSKAFVTQDGAQRFANAALVVND